MSTTMTMSPMTTEAALLAAIIRDPDEDTPRLAYADLLDELGGEENTARAAFIRLQIEYARLPADDPGRARLCERMARVADDRLVGWVPVGTIRPRLHDFRRGFFADWRTSPRGFSRFAGRVLAAAPVALVEFDFRDRAPLPRDWLAPALGCRDLARVRGLSLSSVPLTRDHLADLVASPFVDGLTRLEVSGTGVGDAGVDVLAAWRGGLRALGLGRNMITEAGLRTLAGASALATVEELNLSGNLLLDAGAAVLAGPTVFRNLRRLSLRHVELGEAGARALAGSPYLGAVEYLDLTGNPGVEPRGWIALHERFGRALDVL